ncbi:MAG: DUF4249 family protein, partial [Butyrivibrio sp.]|nr:DUF4249 family protein [Butyrivibrio sp.]
MKPLIYLSLLLPLLLTSCVKDVIMDAKEKPAVAVACILSDDPVQELHIVYTKGASLKEAPIVMEAEALLKDLTTGETRYFERNEDGIWRMDYAAVPLHKYKLEVNVPGYDTLWAEDAMPDSFKVVVSHVYFLEQYLESPTGYVDGVYAVEPPHNIIKDRYWKDGENLPRGESRFTLLASINDPVWLYALNYNPVTGQREIADEICSNLQGEDDFNLTGRTYDPPQWEEPLPYSIRPQYSQGGYSILQNLHTKYLYPDVEGRPVHKKYIHYLPRELVHDMREVFCVSGTFSGEYNCPDNIFYYNYHGNPISYVRDLADDEGYVVCMAVSEVLDKYFKNA